MKSHFDDVILLLKSVSQDEFIRILERVLDERNIDIDGLMKRHFILAIAQSERDGDDNWGNWEILPLAYEDQKEYPDGAEVGSIAQYGTCPNYKNEVVSNVKHAYCSVCGSVCYLT
jgi:hypothetical protein